MESSVATSMEEEAFEAAKNFEDEFNFRKIETMIHRFPPGLGEISSRYPSMVVPRFVAIGPYHHGKKHLEKMEAVKKAAAHYLCQRSEKLGQAVKTAAHFLCQRSEKLGQAVKAAAHYLCQLKRGEKHALDDATKEVLAGVEEALRKYIADETVTEEDTKDVLDVLAAVEEAGPYHHGKKHLEKMEAVKKAAAHYLCQRSEKLGQAVNAAARYLCQPKRGEKHALDDATKEVLAGVEEALRKYIEEETVTEEDTKDVLAVLSAVEEAGHKYIVDETVSEEGMIKDNAHFADMMLCDACFLLLYMDAYKRSYGDKEDYVVNMSMRRFLFSNRDSINNDIMLLENQLPWRVIQVLMRLGGSDLKDAVEHFIASMGSSFKIRESSKLEPYVWDDEKNPPPHLLALLRRHKTDDPDKMIHSASAEPGGSSTSVDVLSDDDVENNNHHLLTPSNNLEDPLTHQALTPPSPTSSSTQEGNPQAEVVISAISPMDLKEIGIELTASPMAKFSDMGLEEGWLWSSLTLAPLSLGDTRASCLVNMAAFEVCIASRFGDPPERTAVCSYLALLAFFMVGSEDVRKLRSMGLLNGPDSDDDMLAFFKTLMKHLPDYGTHFAFVMRDIEEYKNKRRFRTTVYKWLYNNYVSIIKVVTVLATLIGLYPAFLSLVEKKNS